MLDARKIVEEINKLKCKEHNAFAEATMVNGNVAVSTCCQDLQRRAESVIRPAVSSQIDKKVDDKFNETKSETI